MEAKEEEKSYETIILDCAEKSFAEKGFANSKLMSIAEMANVNHALIHYYFRTKDHLYENVVQRLFQKWEVKIKTFEWEGEEPKQVVGEYIEKYFYFHIESDNYQKIRMWDRIENKNLFPKYIEKYWKEDLDNKIRKIEEWQKQGLLRKEINAEFLMHSIWSLVNYFYPFGEKELQKMFGNEEPLEKNYENIIGQIRDLVETSIFL